METSEHVCNSAWAAVGNFASMCGVAESFHFHYSLGDMLGHGAQGIVHACVHRHSGRSCAVKLISRRCKDAFRHEVDMLKVCQSGDNLIQMHEYFTGHFYHYIVLDLYACHLQAALRRVIKRVNGKTVGLGDSSLCRIVRQGLRALTHLHKHNIVHRDVKAENFLTDRPNLDDADCHVVLSDFGLSQRLRRGYFLRAHVGTEKYWAPEIYDSKYAHEVDIFAFGVVAFATSIGVFPFVDEKAVRSQDPFEGRAAGPAVQSFIQCCLEKIPQRRLTAAALATHEWVASTEQHGRLPRLLATVSEPAPSARKELRQTSTAGVILAGAPPPQQKPHLQLDDVSTTAGSPESGKAASTSPPMVAMVELTHVDDDRNYTKRRVEWPKIDGTCVQLTTVNMSLEVAAEPSPNLVQQWVSTPMSQSSV